MNEFVDYYQFAVTALKTQRAQIQLGAIIACLGAAWLLAQVIKPRLSSPTPNWKFGAGSALRLLFPLLALAFVWVVKFFMAKSGAVEILKIAVVLLLSFVLIRFTIYVLRHVFPPSALLKSWERVIAYTTWSAVAMHVMGLAQPLLDLFNELTFKFGKQEISVLEIVQAVLIIVATVLVALWLARLAENRLIRSPHFDLSLRVVMSKVMRAVLLVLAILVALSVVGIDITLLSVFSGALGVGVGIGLQKIASNYISGFIILLDRSIRIGDLITLDNRHGVVTQLHTRYTVVKTREGTEAIIPNEFFITNTVINYSYSDARVLVTLPFTVSYDEVPETVLQIALDCAAKQARVLKDPAPAAMVKSLGNNSIEIELGFWVEDAQNGLGPVRSDIFLALWHEFQARGIKMPPAAKEVVNKQ
ncbi:MAG: mechanosensitive ion channel domain-containing protein [Burkholderiales bacterium]